MTEVLGWGECRPLLPQVGERQLQRDQGVEDGEHFQAIAEDALEAVAGVGLVPPVPLPAAHHFTGDTDVPPQLVQRVAAHEEPAEEGRLALRRLERLRLPPALPAGRSPRPPSPSRPPPPPLAPGRWPASARRWPPAASTSPGWTAPAR